MAFLKVENISKNFGETEVLKSVSFDMEKGEVVSIIGSSGSGKTTLLRCLNFLETADSGSFSVDGEMIFPVAEEKEDKKVLNKNRLSFGLVFQNFNLFPQYTALQNITLAMNLRVENELKEKKIKGAEKKKILKAEKERTKKRRNNYLFVWAWKIKCPTTLASFLAVSNSVLRLQGLWRYFLRFCVLTSLRLLLTPSLRARY